MSVIKVGLLGLGTVGSGVVKTIRLQEEKLFARLGKRIEIVKVLVRDPNKQRRVTIDRQLLTTSFEEVLEAQPQVIIEAIGGVEPTFDYLEQAFRAGCHVVTANKELLAKRGHELIQLANQYQSHFYYEASVAGGIPILHLLRQYLRTNEILSIQGILNGTTNYILTKMEHDHRDYEDVLQEAQQLGYAEADPTSDVEGYDALYKLYILSQLVFGQSQELQTITRQGISDISIDELQLVRNLGYRFKLLARAKKTANRVQLSVQPTLLPLDHPLAGISDAYNGIQINGNIVGELLLTGKGAGEFPTASSVVEDLAYLLTQPYSPHPAWRFQRLEEEEAVPTFIEKQFIYLEASASNFSVHDVVEYMEREGIKIHQLTTVRNQVGGFDAGLVVQGFTQEHLIFLQNHFLLEVKQYPLIDDHTEVVTQDRERTLEMDRPKAVAQLL